MPRPRFGLFSLVQAWRGDAEALLLPRWGRATTRSVVEGALPKKPVRPQVPLSRFAPAPSTGEQRAKSFGAGLAIALAAALLAAPALAHADALGAYYERSVMTAANQRCGLFTPDLSSALATAQAQARGAALRSGAASAALVQIEARARGRAGSVACTSPDIIKAADRVRGAFDGFSRLQRMNFPGDTSDWMANRGVSRLGPVWKLSQTARFDGAGLVFGLAGQGEARVLLAVVGFSGNAQPYAARLIMRDAALAPESYLNAIQARGRGPLPLDARTPPRSATIGVLAEARAPADAALLPSGVRAGYAFRFPAAAIATLADLDPREAVAVEFLFADGARDAVRTAYVEVGDFAAGRAFLTAAQR